MTWKNKALSVVAMVSLLATGVVEAQAQDVDGTIPAGEPDAMHESLAEQEAQDDLDELEEEDLDEMVDDLLGPDEEDKPWSVSGSMRMSIGQGTFARIANDSQWAGEVHDGSGAYNRVSMNFGVSPSYRWNDFSFGASFGVSQGLTAGGGMNRPYETRLGDVSLSAGWRGHTFDAIGVTVTPSLRMTLPTSVRSQFTTLRLGTGASVGVSKRFFNAISLSYSLGAGRSFYEFRSPIVEVDRIGEENAIFRIDGAEAVQPGRFAVGGVNTPWSMSNSFSASFALGRVSTSLSYTYTRRWSYKWTEEDEFTSDFQCVGRCVGDGMSGSLSLGYSLNDWLSLSGSLSSGGQPKTADQRSFNFPFWNFNGAAGGGSSIALGLSGRY